MTFPNQETQFKPGQSGNPSGKPKGTVHLSTMIQSMLNDKGFTPATVDTKQLGKSPMRIIIAVGINKAIDGDIKWADWLAKHGYGTEVKTLQDTEMATGIYSRDCANEFAEYLKNKTYFEGLSHHDK